MYEGSSTVQSHMNRDGEVAVKSNIRLRDSGSVVEFRGREISLVMRPAGTFSRSSYERNLTKEHVYIFNKNLYTHFSICILFFTIYFPFSR